MALNSRGLFITLKESFDLLRKPGASIVITASLNSWKGDENIVPYVASKHAALGVMRSAALDFGRSGIRVNAIAPGPVATQALLSRIKKRNGGDEDAFQSAIEKLAKSTALGRLATVEDVANTALFLSSDLANGITGQMINVDAGVM
jgi:NAD(P)-dependent dehydrogenase (short-subunit alcohol dehydrogenase family)